MADRAFIDTNVFVYAGDADEPAKNAVARGLIQQLAREGRGVLSTQVLMEYVAAASRGLGLSLGQCRQAVLLMSRFDVVVLKPDHVLGALDLAGSYAISHWDALILKAASTSGCRVLFTEEMQHGRTIDGVVIQNPFVSKEREGSR